MFELPSEKFLDDIVSSLSLEQKISQLFIVGYLSENPDDKLLEWVNDYLGGLILFRHNIKSLESALSNNLRFNNLSKLPLFISIDQEGGLVERISGLTQVPSPMGLSAIGDLESVNVANKIITEELRLLGFNLNFTPVLDVNTEPKNPIIGLRSFGDNVDIVSNYGNAVIDASKAFGIIPVAKHFPGHGATYLDSHLTLPSLALSEKELFGVHLPPFISAIEHGIDMIMVCHIFFDNYSESENIPASLSKSIILDLLINNLGFNGVVITDDLNMSAISEMFTPEEVVVKAINAGVDILLYRDHRDAKVAHGLLCNQVMSGVIDESRIDYSLKKILSLKYKYALDKSLIGQLDNLNTLSEKLIINKCISQGLSNKSISVYKSLKGTEINFASEKLALVKVSKSGFSHFISEPELQIEELIHGVDIFDIPLNPDLSDVDTLINQLNNYDKIIIISYNAVFNKNQELLINTISNMKPSYLLVAGSPFDAPLLDQVEYSSISYGYSNNAIRSFIKLLKSEIMGNKNIPVNLLLSK